MHGAVLTGGPQAPRVPHLPGPPLGCNLGSLCISLARCSRSCASREVGPGEAMCTVWSPQVLSLSEMGNRGQAHTSLLGRGPCVQPTSPAEAPAHRGAPSWTPWQLPARPRLPITCGR